MLPVIVAAEGGSAAEVSSLLSRWHTTGRLSVDLAVDPPADQHEIRLDQ
jgi:hypothetical protein